MENTSRYIIAKFVSKSEPVTKGYSKPKKKYSVGSTFLDSKPMSFHSPCYNDMRLK